MHQVRFRKVEDFLDFLPEDERQITEYLRDVIQDVIPDVIEKLSYNVPFFRRHKALGYLWPGAVLWGKQRSYEGVEMGFQQGHLFADADQFLQKGKRKHVYYVRFTRLEEIDARAVQQLWLETWMIDDELQKSRVSGP